MKQVNETAIYRAALDKWGPDAQLDQAVEEMGELISALMHYRRGKKSSQEVLGEMADVQIMLEQLALMFGQQELVKARAEKLRILAGMLK